MDELKEKKLNILKGKIKEINEQESKEQESIPVRKTRAKKSAPLQIDQEEQRALRRKKGLLVQLMYYINKRDFRINNQQ